MLWQGSPLLPSWAPEPSVPHSCLSCPAHICSLAQQWLAGPALFLFSLSIHWLQLLPAPAGADLVPYSTGKASGLPPGLSFVPTAQAIEHLDLPQPDGTGGQSATGVEAPVGSPGLSLYDRPEGL